MAFNVAPKTHIRTECTIQFEQTDCGAACLSTVLKYYGRYVSLSELRSACHIGRDGSSVKKILVGAGHYGLMGKAFRRNAQQLMEQGNLPAILFWNRNHFVVYEGYDPKYVYISDPAQGRRKVDHAEFTGCYSGFCVDLRPSDDFIPGGIAQSPWSVLGPYIQQYRGYLALSAFLGAATAVPTLVYAGCSQEFVNSFLQEGRIYFGLPVIWILAAAISLNVALSWLQYVLLRRLQVVFVNDISTSIFRKVLSLDYLYFSQRLTGELANRVTAGLQLPQVLMNVIFRFLIALTRSLVVTIAALFISPMLVAMIAIIVFANLSLSYVLIYLRRDDNRVLAISSGQAAGISMQGIAQAESIKAAGLELEFLRRWQQSFISVVNQNQLLGRLNAYSSTVSSGSSFLLVVLTVIVGGILIVAGRLSLGQLVAFQLLQSQVISPISMIPQVTGVYQQLVGILARVADIYEGPSDSLVEASMSNALNRYRTSNQYSSPQKKLPPINSLDIKSVYFSYDGSEDYVISSLNLSFKRGKHYAFVGSSGSGKSTVVKLIIGLLQPSSGSVLYDDQGWEDIGIERIRASIGYVSQDPFIFSASFKDNVSMYSPTVSDEQVWKALASAEIANEVAKYPDTIYHQLADAGSDLSGGQRQRLEISRALVNGPSILILDEATSSLDVASEARILKNLSSQGITIISIAHRLVAAMESDHIYVFDKGVIIEQGSPTYLIQRSTSRFSQLSKDEQL